jgi:hypothetical protein
MEIKMINFSLSFEEVKSEVLTEVKASRTTIKKIVGELAYHYVTLGHVEIARELYPAMRARKHALPTPELPGATLLEDNPGRPDPMESDDLMILMRIQYLADTYRWTIRVQKELLDSFGCARLTKGKQRQMYLRDSRRLAGRLCEKSQYGPDWPPGWETGMWT